MGHGSAVLDALLSGAFLAFPDICAGGIKNGTSEGIYIVILYTVPSKWYFAWLVSGPLRVESRTPVYFSPFYLTEPSSPAS